jgi:hypothetical protein
MIDTGNWGWTVRALCIEVTPIGEIGPYSFEVGELTRSIAGDYEKLVRGQLVTA